MHVEFTDEQEALRRVVRDFADGEIAPHAERWDAEHTFPTDVVLALGELGVFGIPFPEEYGGGGADLTTLCIAIEELARVDQSLAITLEAAVGLGANPIYRFGTEAQRQEWLPDLCAGRALGGFGLTEPDAGSDAGGTRTTARLEGGGGNAGDGPGRPDGGDEATAAASGSSTARRRSSPTRAPTSRRWSRSPPAPAAAAPARPRSRPSSCRRAPRA